MDWDMAGNCDAAENVWYNGLCFAVVVGRCLPIGQ